MKFTTPPPRSLAAEAPTQRPAQPVRPAGLRPAQGVLHRPSGFGQLSLDLRPRG
jgi:hypothetical protein